LSNTFMTIAWYGHLKQPTLPLWKAILGSWLIAFFEYSLQVPANRLGYHYFSAYQLKILQEGIALIVFVFFAWGYLGETPSFRSLVSLALVAGAFALVLVKK
jgi:uncharacterized protein (DUF486 family)